MADTKITALTALTAADPINDVIPIVDVSDTSMAASGTTKKISVNNLLSSSPTASGALTVSGLVTAGSATITGNLTVSTAAQFNGGATAGYLNSSLFFGSSGGFLNLYSAATGFNLKDNTGAFNIINTTNAGVFTFGDGAGGTRMTLNSTGLGVGVSPSFKLSAAGVSQFYAESDGIYASGNLSPDLYTIGVNYWNAAGTEGIKVSARPSWKIEHKNSSDALAYLDIGFRAASAAASAFTSRFKIDGSGNVGIGVTPSAWWSGFKAVEYPNGVALLGQTNVPFAHLSTNAYAGVPDWLYKVSSNYALRYAQDATTGNHIWFNSGVGTAGNPITFTQAMTLDASGNLLVGKTISSFSTVGIESSQTGFLSLTNSASTNAATNISVYSTGAAAFRFYVGLAGTVFATNTTISAISDARLKENVQDIDVGLDAILSLKPRKFDWKAGKGKDIKGDRGFIAQEFETVFPNLIDEWKDEAPEGEAPYKSVRQDLIPVLVKAIQELTARVQTLEAR